MKKLLGLLSFFRKANRFSRKQPAGVIKIKPAPIKEELKQKVSDYFNNRTIKWLDKVNKNNKIVVGRIGLENFITRNYGSDFITRKQFSSFKRSYMLRIKQIEDIKNGNITTQKLKNFTNWYNSLFNKKYTSAIIERLVRDYDANHLLYKFNSQSEEYYRLMIEMYGYEEAVSALKSNDTEKKHAAYEELKSRNGAMEDD